MAKRFTVEEAFVKKRFKQDGFKVFKLDMGNKYKAPDFKISKRGTNILVEVKIGFKKGQTLETLSTGAFRLNPASAVEDYFLNATLKYKDYTSHFPGDNKLPYILVFISPFFISNELVWSKTLYKKYSAISAVFIPHRVHPLDNKANEMTLEQLEKIINSTHIPFNSQTKIGWKIIKNPYAITRIKVEQFNSIYMVKRPISNIAND